MTEPPANFVPFSSRYGLVEGIEGWGRMHWTGRHADHGPVQFDTCHADRPRTRCACPGSGGERQCCEKMTGEDLMCDQCREHCKALDPRTGRYYSSGQIWGWRL